MAAALALPGLAPVAGHAEEGDSADFQYGHYEEGHRTVYAVDIADPTDPKSTQLVNKPVRYHNPITVDTLRGGAKVSLTDRLKFGFHYTQDTWSGATPISSGPAGFGFNIAVPHTAAGASPIIATPKAIQQIPVFDRKLQPLRLANTILGNFVRETQLTHVLSTASPETRQQGDFKLRYGWDDFELSGGGGLSVERDYESRFGNLGAHWDLDRKLTTVDLGLSYTDSDTRAILDPALISFTQIYGYKNQITEEAVPAPGSPDAKLHHLDGNRQDWAATAGISRVLGKSAVLQAGAGYTRSTGYLANPYKVVETFWLDPNSPQNPELPDGAREAQATAAFLEKRPQERNQWTLDLRYVQQVAPLDAALHLGYRYFRDDWDIDAHTFEADWVQPLGGGWTLTPRARYYSQSAADFYHPYLVMPHAYLNPVPSAAGDVPYKKNQAKNLSRLPSAYSSDHRLSAYGAFSWGVTLSKRFSRGVSLEAGFEHYSHGGGLKLGGGGEADFADFDYWVANAALKVDLSAPGRPGDEAHALHAHHAHAPVPAGVMFAHLLEQPGALMAGYRYMYARQAGGMLHGALDAADRAVIGRGCPERHGCFFKPLQMDMQMHMLDLMYAPTSWLNLMVMPQFADMSMVMSEQLREKRADEGIGVHVHGGAHIPLHATGGIGDTGMYALVKLLNVDGHRLHAALGVSAPTGAVNKRLRRPTAAYREIYDAHRIKIDQVPIPELLADYGMQLGSGTWDFKPSLTYAGRWDAVSWGAQAAATVRTEDQNDSGYALGDVFQASVWAGYSPLPWMTLTTRGVYTTQGRIRHQYDDPAETGVTTDYPANYGGRSWDLGFGLTATVPSGTFQGNQLGVEWLQPLYENVNGYQLQRQGTLYATWNLEF